jgi:hypothetical protein
MLNLNYLLKQIFKRILLFLYNILVKRISSGRETLPKKFVYELYEIFNYTRRNKTVKKACLPYVDVDIFNRQDLNRPYEVLNVELLRPHSKKIIAIDKSSSFVLPIAMLDKNGNDINNDFIDIFFSNQKVKLELKYKNRFHYLPIKASTKIDSVFIKSTKHDLAIGNPVYLDKIELKNKTKLVVHIFIDALSKVMLEEAGGKDIMPYTKSFFATGTVFENTFSQGDWTLTSMSGIFTGKYTKDHLVYHPRRPDKIKNITLAETLNNEGYLTSMFSSNSRLTPVNGFDQGFDRCVIAPFKSADYIINEAIEQLESFNGSQYLFISLFDIHEAHKLQPISIQVKNQLSDFQYREIKGSKGVAVLQDLERIRMCIKYITYLDLKLNLLYKKINQYDQNATVVLHSDHGVDYITKNTKRLSKEKQKVVLMMKGLNTPAKVDFNIQEVREVPSMILKGSNIDDKMKYVNSGFAITESIYPKQEYELAIRNNKYVLFFQVPWKDLEKRNVVDYVFTASFHNIKTEKEILHNKCYELMLSHAKNHYRQLIRNLRIYNKI